LLVFVSPEAVAGSGQGENSNDCDETHENAHECSATGAGKVQFREPGEGDVAMKRAGREKWKRRCLRHAA
jgi:hypothetical protein